MLTQSIYHETEAFTQDIIRVDSPSWQEKNVADLVINKMQSQACGSI